MCHRQPLAKQHGERCLQEQHALLQSAWGWRADALPSTSSFIHFLQDWANPLPSQSSTSIPAFPLTLFNTAILWPPGTPLLHHVFTVLGWKTPRQANRGSLKWNSSTKRQAYSAHLNWYYTLAADETGNLCSLLIPSPRLQPEAAPCLAGYSSQHSCHRTAPATGQPCAPRLQHHWATPTSGRAGVPGARCAWGPLSEPGVREDSCPTPVWGWFPPRPRCGGHPLPEPGVGGIPCPTLVWGGSPARPGMRGPPPTPSPSEAAPAPRRGQGAPQRRAAAPRVRGGGAGGPLPQRGRVETYPCSPSPGPAGHRGCPRRAAELPSAGAPQAAGGGGGGHAGSRVPALPLSGRGGEGGPAALLGRTPRGPPRRLPLRAPLRPRAPPRPRTDPEAAAAAPRGALPRPGRRRDASAVPPAGRGGARCGLPGRAGRGRRVGHAAGPGARSTWAPRVTWCAPRPPAPPPVPQIILSPGGWRGGREGVSPL